MATWKGRMRPGTCSKSVCVEADWQRLASVELVDWQKETERDLHVTLHCFTWWLEERQDMGVQGNDDCYAVSLGG